MDTKKATEQYAQMKGISKEDAAKELGIPAEAKYATAFKVLDDALNEFAIKNLVAKVLAPEEGRGLLKEAIQEGRAGISRVTHFIVCLEDEPDAIPIPYSSVFDPTCERLKNMPELTSEARPEPKPKLVPIRSGSNYTAPKKKRKKRR
jgi:hypothetical protein